MAYEQNPIPNNLRPINIPRTLVDESRIIAPVTLAPSTSSPGSIPVYYPSRVAATDSGFIGLNYGNAVTAVGNWLAPVPPPAKTGVALAPGYVYNPSPAIRVIDPNLSLRGGAGGSAGCSTGGGGCGSNSNASDHVSDEGGNDSASGRKVKFLCSFGGKILPRPSDGVLRYVGGDTRIISVRRDVGFSELVMKMFDTYGRNVVIKYQLPDEDLDALVTVSRPDDLENMMDEYDKLVERSSNGSAKLRVFLFSELESSSMIQLSDLQDSGQRYVEAVNGIPGGGMSRKESIASHSTQNSELSGTEGGVESTGHDQGEVTGPPSTIVLSPVENSPAGIAVAIPALSAQPELGLERPVPIHVQQPLPLGYDLQPPVVTIPPPSPYVQAYVDTHGTFNRTEYVPVPSQMGFPAQIMGTVSPVYSPPPFQDNAVSVAPNQFIPAVQISLAPSSHVSFKPNPVSQIVQPQMVQMEHYPEERTFVQPSYSAYQPPAQVSPLVLAGSCGRNQVLPPDQVVFSDGRMPQQQPLIYPEPVLRFDGCIMCQKASPDAPSDPVAPERKENHGTAGAGMNSIHQSLRLEDIRRMMQPNRVNASGALGVGHVEKHAVGVRSRFAGQNDYEAGKSQFDGIQGQFVNDSVISQRAEILGHGMVSAAVPMQYQVINQETMVKNRASGDSSPAEGPSPSSDHQVYESLKDYPGNFPVIVSKGDNIEPAFTYENLRQIDVRMEDLCIHPNEVFVHNDQSPVENRPENVLENRSPGTELYLDKPQMVLDAHYIKQNEIMPCSSEVPRSYGFQPMESYGMTQQPPFSSVAPAYVTEVSPPVSNWNVYPLQVEPKLITTDVDPVLMDSLSPFDGDGKTQDSSNSLFSNQDPWMMRHDSHFPPPRPSKILTKKEVGGAKEAASDNRLGHNGESPTGNPVGVTNDMRVDDGAPQSTSNSDSNLSLERGHSSKGSAEELVKQELQAVAEGVAASVLHSSTPSNPDSSRQGRVEYASESDQIGDVQYSNADVQPEDKIEDQKVKLPEKSHLGFPASDGVGRLQIIKNSDLEELRELGSGTFGTVYHGKWRGSDVAIKRINDRCFAGKASEQERMREDFWNEAIKLADLHHPNVVAFYGVVRDGPGGSVATVTEYMVNGSLRTALQKNERNLDKRKRLLIAMDVAFGMEYLHGKNIVHFDLKSDNLLVNLRDPHRPICKVGDLGLSKVKRQTLISGGVRGTLPWMAPELLNGSSSLVSEKVDVFSFGIVMWELLTGDEPYADLHYGAIIGGIVSNTLRPPVPESFDPEWRSLMERCWSAEPSERPSFTEVANQLRIITSKLPPKLQPYQ